jgi:hypothetical protein
MTQQLVSQSIYVPLKHIGEKGDHTVYKDETYIHSSHTTYNEQDDILGAGLKALVSKECLITHSGKNTCT